MKKFFVIFFILILIFSTAIIKNSTKRIDDNIFVIKENIRSYKKDFEDIKLEYNYLSSAERLLGLQKLYFDNELIERNIEDLRTITKNLNRIEITKYNFTDEK
tara:strand:- start:410 stop:718 length:309 start_codon:yes stop_codon:yes gene_type:complete